MKRLLSNIPSALLIYVVMAVMLLPWAFSLLRTPPHSDLLWLYEAFSRFATGQSLMGHIYEPNPPLSLFTYAVPYFITGLTSLPASFVLFTFVMLLLVLSALAVHHISSKILSDNRPAAALTIAYIFSQTMVTLALYGERDQIVALGLIPFVFMQLALLRGLSFSRLFVWTVFALGTFCILLKPHHGLIPFLIIAWRFFQDRNIKSLLKPDTICLSAGVILYGLLLLLFFRDYLMSIYPDVWLFYLSERDDHILLTAFLYALFLVSAAGAIFVLRNKIRFYHFIQLLLCASFFSLVPYYVQGKGFYYHLFPALSFFFMAAGLILLSYLQKELKNEKYTLALFLAAFWGVCFFLFPVNFKLPNSQAYKNLPLTKEVQEACAGQEQCSFFMFNDTMGIVHETAYVTGATHGSRFPSYWFLPGLVAQASDDMPAFEKRRSKYADMIADDLLFYKPAILLIGRFRVGEGSGFFNYGDFWSVSEKFRDQWQGYEHRGAITVSYGAYYPGTIIARQPPVIFDVYRLIN